MMMRPHNAFTTYIVVAFLLLLTPVTIWLHSGTVDEKLTTAFIGVALFIFLVARWQYRKSGVVRVVRPYNRMGIGMTFFVAGILLILWTITMHLMNQPMAEQYVVPVGSESIRLPGSSLLFPVIGVVLMLIGLWINQSDKYYIRLEDRV
jgi:hypothetical protein